VARTGPSAVPTGSERRTAMFIVPRRGSGVIAAFVLLYVLLMVVPGM
jgi:hypothetical protein